MIIIIISFVEFYKKREGEPFQELAKKKKKPVETDGETSLIQQDTSDYVSINLFSSYARSKEFIL